MVFDTETIYNLFNQMRGEFCKTLSMTEQRISMIEDRLNNQQQKNNALASILRDAARNLEENV